jgi:tetratricopeptide (TPR) repeat protein
LKIQLVESEKKTLEKKPTENTEAYNDFLRGRELHREGGMPAAKQALALFERAVELDPSFARALVEIAECHIYLADLEEGREAAHSTARASLKRAVELDPGLPEAHAALSHLLFNEDDLLGAEAEARRAVELNPSLADPYSLLSQVAATKGEPEEMVRQMETAYRLDPLRPLFVYLLGQAYVWTGREAEALEHWRKTEPLSPAYTYRGMVEYYLSKGDVGKAKEYYAKFEQLQPTHFAITWIGGALAARQGDREGALLAVKKLEETKLGPVAYNYIAYVYHALGGLDSYFEWMNRAASARAQIQSPMMYSPLLAKAREDPRYGELVEKLRKQKGLAK